MKKTKAFGFILLGFILGLSISYAPQLEAATSKLLGNKVSKVLKVKIDSREIGEGAVINGTTLVPLRVIANEAGMEVIKVDSKEVVLSTPTTDTSSEESALINQITEVNKKIKTAKSVIANKEGALRQIKASQEYLSNYEKFKDTGSEFYTEEYRKVEFDKMNNLQKVLDDAEINLPIWEQELAELELKLAELQK